MQGAREYAKWVKNPVQIGRLYLLPGRHARGKTFRIYVLPHGEDVQEHGPNPPLNKDAVEVYGVVGGNPGWSEWYDWKFTGQWILDFKEIINDLKVKEADARSKEEADAERERQAEEERQYKLLSTY